MSPRSDTCPVQVYSDHRDVRGHRCNRPIKDDGLCALHLAAKRRRQANQAKRVEDRSADQARLAAADALCERLAAVGVTAVPAWNSIAGTYTGGITLDAASALTLLSRAGVPA